MFRKRWQLLFVIFTLFFMGYMSKIQVSAAETIDQISADELAGKTAGVMVGTPQDDIIGNSIKDVQFLP